MAGHQRPRWRQGCSSSAPCDPRSSPHLMNAALGFSGCTARRLLGQNGWMIDLPPCSESSKKEGSCEQRLIVQGFCPSHLRTSHKHITCHMIYTTTWTLLSGCPGWTTPHYRTRLPDRAPLGGSSSLRCERLHNKPSRTVSSAHTKYNPNNPDP